MALFSRLFGGKKQSEEPIKCSECKWPLLEGSVKWDIPDFDPSQVRLVIFKDSVGDRIPLFDSRAIKRIVEQGAKKPCCSKQKPKESTLPKFHFSRPCSDTKMLGEMMFGSVAMSYHGSSIKVHSIRCPPQLMFTKILTGSATCFEAGRNSSYDVDSYDSYSLQSSFGDVTTDSQIYCRERAQSHPELGRSVPMEIPSPLNKKDDGSLSASLASSGSFTPLFPSSPGNAGSSINSASLKSFQRRWQRIQNTSLEYGVRNRLSDPDPSSGPQSLPTPTCKKSYKLGIGILISSFSDAEKHREFMDLFFSHITLIQRHVEKLAQEVHKAFSNKKQFVHVVMDARDRFVEALKDLFLTPRLTQPVWLNMMSAQTNRQLVCLQFMTEFTNLVLKHESKDTNFFISTLLTAVLTHHLAWVPTVTPSGVLPSRPYMDKHSAKWLDTLAHSHPYNPLWAQLSDLYGAIGYPMKMSRTVIVGQNQPVICTLLYILSYFIRCSEVYERCQIQEPEFFDFEDVATKEMSPIKESGYGEDVRDSGISVGDELKPGVSTETVFRTEAINSKREGWTSESTLVEAPVENKAQSSEAPVANKAQSSEAPVANKAQPSEAPVANKAQPSEAPSANKAQPSQAPIANNAQPSEAPTSDDATESLQCKLSTNAPVPAKLENIQQVKRANIAAKSPKTNSIFYVRLPSNDEAIVTEMDEYFDGEAEARTFRECKKCKCGKLTCFTCNYKLDSMESIGTRSDDAGFVSMESQSETSDVGTDIVKRGTGPRVLSPIQSPRSMSATSELNDDVDVRRRHASGERSALSRQLSQTNAPARCKSLTPTELGRRRHVSGSSLDSESADPFLRLREVPLPGPERDCPLTEFPRNFGHSLMAGVSDHYLSDFVLHGTCDPKFYQKLEDDLSWSAKISVLDEPVGEAVCVVANVDHNQVFVLASNQNEKLTSPTIASSQLVSNLVEGVSHFWKLRMPPEFCLMHLEDRLQEIYFKSRMLAEYLRHQKQSNIKELTQVLGFDCSDLPLLLAVASTHSPELVFGIS